MRHIIYVDFPWARVKEPSQSRKVEPCPWSTYPKHTDRFYLVVSWRPCPWLDDTFSRFSWQTNHFFCRLSGSVFLQVCLYLKVHPSDTGRVKALVCCLVHFQFIVSNVRMAWRSGIRSLVRRVAWSKLELWRVPSNCFRLLDVSHTSLIWSFLWNCMIDDYGTGLTIFNNSHWWLCPIVTLHWTAHYSLLISPQERCGSLLLVYQIHVWLIT